MAEVGCLKDGCFQNLKVEGKTLMNGQHVTGNHSVTGNMVVTGDHSVTGDVVVTGNQSVTGTLTGAAPTIVKLGTTGPIDLTEADHAGRILHVPATTGAVTYTIPNPTSTSIEYNFLYIGAAAAGDSIVIRRAVNNVTGAEGSVFVGNILTSKQDAPGAGDTTTIFANGETDGTGTDTFTSLDTETLNLTLRCSQAHVGVGASLLPGIFVISGHHSGTSNHATLTDTDA